MQISGQTFHKVTEIKAHVYTSEDKDFEWVVLTVHGLDLSGKMDSVTMSFFPADRVSAEELLKGLKNG